MPKSVLQPIYSQDEVLLKVEYTKDGKPSMKVQFQRLQLLDPSGHPLPSPLVMPMEEWEAFAHVGELQKQVLIQCLMPEQHGPTAPPEIIH